MANRRPTIIDVAREAGVSKSTVSLVIRNPEGAKEETRARVQHAMSKIGYFYNRAAATMRSGQVGLIGLIINDLRNPFFTEFAASLQMHLSKAGYAVILANTEEDADQQRDTIFAMIEHNVSALIISPAYGDVADSFNELQRAGIPLIQVMRQVDYRTDLFPFIAPNYFEGGKQATEHLLQKGAKSIAFIGGLEGRSVTLERMSGYLDALGVRGKTPRVFTGRTDRTFGREMAHHILRFHPDIDAALCFSDFVALGVAAGLQECFGLKSQARIRLAGFDDIEEARYGAIPISSVHCDIPKLAAITAERILGWLATGRRPVAIERTQARFIARDLVEQLDVSRSEQGNSSWVAAK